MTGAEKEEKLLRVIHHARFLVCILGNIQTADYELIDIDKTPVSEETEQNFAQRGLTYLGVMSLSHDNGPRCALEDAIPEEDISKISARFLKQLHRELNERVVMERLQRLPVCPGMVN